MKIYYALDYINSHDGECEPVYCDKLYDTEEEATAAREETGRPDLFDITWYGIKDLEEIYNRNIEITPDLMVRVI